jgi:hypothetical protein
MMGGDNPVAFFEFLNSFSNSDDPPGYLVAENKRRLVDPVPFEDITAADPAGFDFHQKLTRTDIRHGLLFYPDIRIAVVYGHTHEICLEFNPWYYVPLLWVKSRWLRIPAAENPN